ncbi:reverse transcriptase domain-containing protein [Tanacetum coccineum]
MSISSGSGVKKKDGGSSKEGVSKDVAGAAPILGDIAKRVKSIDGVINVPKSILRKPARVVSLDVHEGAKPINVEGSGSKVSFEGVSKVSAVSSTQGLGSSNLGSDPTITNGCCCLISNKVHFRTLVNDEKVESVDCVLPKAAAAKVKGRYENSIVGFFLGKDPSFPVVQQYVSNTWRKFGFERITRNDDGVYLFKFATKSGRDQVIEKGPWLIRKSPIILSKWSPSVSLKRGEVTKVPVWVKLYNVPVLAYSEDGLSLLATQIGKPIMLDAFTSSMCVESWGRISFARALIEIDAVVGLKKEVIMAIPEEEGDGYIKEIVRVEYEWKPPHCFDCKSFGHEFNLCPKRVREEVPNNSARDTKATVMVENDDGFTEVKSRKKKKGADSRSFGGLRLNKPNSKVIWQQKKGGDTKGGSKSASPSVSTNNNGNGNGVSNPGLNTANPFDVLNVDGDDMGESGAQPKVSDHVNSVLDENKEASMSSSLNSGYGDSHKDKNASSPPVLKKWDVINESDSTDDEDGFTSYGTFMGGGNQLEEEDFDFYDGYEDQVVDLHGALKEYRDFKLSMSGRK